MTADQFFAAIKRSDAQSVRDILSQQPGLAAAVDEHNWTTLQVAVNYGCNLRTQHNRSVVEALLEHLQPIALGDAAMLGDEQRIKSLLDESVSLNGVDARGWTPLHWASEVGQESAAILLLEAGADPNANSRDGAPLERASHPGPNKPTACQPIIDLLIEHGATVTAHLAALIGNAEKLLQVLEADSAAINQHDDRGATPLYYAAHNLHLDCVELLLNRGADINAKLDDGQTPISTAVDHMWDEGGEAVVQRLLNEQPELDFITAAQVNEVSVVRSQLELDAALAFAEKSAHPVIYLAAGANAGDVIPILIAAGADPNWQREFDGQTPLHNAACHRKTAAVLALLEGGANSNLQDKNGDTPLHNAVARSQVAMVEGFVRSGADTSIQNREGQTAAEIAKQFGNDCVLQLLRATKIE